MSFTISDLPVQERPRERLREFGSESLCLHELIEIILGQGSSAGPVRVISQQLLSHYSNTEQLEAATVQELCQINGIGQAKAIQLKAAFELGRRLFAEQALPQSKSIVTSTAAFKMVSQYLKNKKKEHLLLFPLNVRGQLVSKPEVISVGTLDSSLVHPREIFNAALKRYAAKIILAHNHPSGSALPSTEDIEVTKHIFEASKVMCIEFLDHLVVGGTEYTSIRQLKPELWT